MKHEDYERLRHIMVRYLEEAINCRRDDGPESWRTKDYMFSVGYRLFPTFHTLPESRAWWIASASFLSRQKSFPDSAWVTVESLLDSVLIRLDMDEQQRLSFIERLVTQQAFTLSALDLFYASAIILVLLIPLVWMARPPRRQGGAAAAGAH